MPIIFLISLIFIDAILSAFCEPSNKILSKYFASFNNLFISLEIGLIFSTNKSESFSLNSEKFFPLNSFFDCSIS